ncbi:MAG: ribose 5-phosphate isomerase B [Lachnospiraceae bacterium]|nr:ribose 5-phosphate isomerase B [Lachnospiraceae bacterium]MBR6271709.1 ribose 5-phosphate isomerase B [Lachnospiraceae bacterium]
MIIGFGCDHAGLELKKELMEYLASKGHECIDYSPLKEGEKSDYPIAGRAVGEAVAAGEVEKGVLVCGTGIGISLTANKVPGVRAAVCSEPFSARMSVCHNDANIIAVGARVIGVELAKMIVDEFFSAGFEGGRHQTRVDMIKATEDNYSKYSF